MQTAALPFAIDHPPAPLAVPAVVSPHRIPRLALREPTFELLAHVIAHMRPLDQREVFGLLWLDDGDNAGLATLMLELQPASWIAVASDGEPVYAFAVNPLRPGVWECGGFATARWPAVAHAVTGFTRRLLATSFESGTAHRVECKSLAEKVDNHRWLKFLGAVEECTLPKYGRNGETYKLFAWR